MNNRRKFAPLNLVLAAAVLVTGMIGGLSILTKANPTHAAPVPQPQASCNAVTVTNISTQSVALGQAEKITVDWTFTPPAGDAGCFKVDSFEVWIEVERRSGRKNNRKIDASATAHSVNAQFSEAGIGNLQDNIKSVKAIVTAKLANATGQKTLSGL